eukprot:scaffold124256_cov49-Attheya_sp.AAC.2
MDGGKRDETVFWGDMKPVAGYTEGVREVVLVLGCGTKSLRPTSSKQLDFWNRLSAYGLEAKARPSPSPTFCITEAITDPTFCVTKLKIST